MLTFSENMENSSTRYSTIFLQIIPSPIAVSLQATQVQLDLIRG